MFVRPFHILPPVCTLNCSLIGQFHGSVPVNYALTKGQFYSYLHIMTTTDNPKLVKTLSISTLLRQNVNLSQLHFMLQVGSVHMVSLNETQTQAVTRSSPENKPDWRPSGPAMKSTQG